MNISQGFFRLWMIVIVLCAWNAWSNHWISISGNASVGCWVAPADPSRPQLINPERLPPSERNKLSKNDTVECGGYVSDEIKEAIWGVLTIPVLLLIIWFVSGWVRRGFRTPLEDKQKVMFLTQTERRLGKR